MIITKFLFYIFIIDITICNGHITIDMEPDELQRMGEILVETYLHQQLTHRLASSVLLSHGKIFVYGAMQLIGLLLTLVGANIARTRLEHFLLPTSRVVNISAALNVSNFEPSKLCKRDFGCDDNICWRTCDDKLGVSEENKSWCYTSPKTNEKKTFSSVFIFIRVFTVLGLLGTMQCTTKNFKLIQPKQNPY